MGRPRVRGITGPMSLALWPARRERADAGRARRQGARRGRGQGAWAGGRGQGAPLKNRLRFGRTRKMVVADEEIS